jgi:hypothetical protein
MNEEDLLNSLTEEILEIFKKKLDLNENLNVDSDALTLARDTRLLLDDIKILIDNLTFKSIPARDLTHIKSKELEAAVNNLAKSVAELQSEKINEPQYKQSALQEGVSIINIQHYESDLYKVHIENFTDQAVLDLKLDLIIPHITLPILRIPEILKFQNKEFIVKLSICTIAESGPLVFNLYNKEKNWSTYAFVLVTIEEIIPYENFNYQVRLRNNTCISIKGQLVYMTNENAEIVKELEIKPSALHLFSCTGYRPGGYSIYAKNRYISNAYNSLGY